MKALGSISSTIKQNKPQKAESPLKVLRQLVSAQILRQCDDQELFPNPRISLSEFISQKIQVLACKLHCFQTSPLVATILTYQLFSKWPQDNEASTLPWEFPGPPVLYSISSSTGWPLTISLCPTPLSFLPDSQPFSKSPNFRAWSTWKAIYLSYGALETHRQCFKFRTNPLIECKWKG